MTLIHFSYLELGLFTAVVRDHTSSFYESAYDLIYIYFIFEGNDICAVYHGIYFKKRAGTF